MSTQAETPVRIWIATYTTPNAEIAVRDAVRALGYPVLLPTAMTEMRHARQVMMVDRPVFPRYAFVGVPPGQSWYPIKAVSGVAGILSTNGEPRAVPRKAVDLLKAAVEADAFTTKARPMFSEGDRVKVTVGDGEIEAFVGRINASLPAQRIEVVFKLFGKEHRSTADVDHVRAA